jgi:hypothetical protein
MFEFSMNFGIARDADNPIAPCTHLLHCLLDGVTKLLSILFLKKTITFTKQMRQQVKTYLKDIDVLVRDLKLMIWSYAYSDETVLSGSHICDCGKNVSAIERTEA